LRERLLRNESAENKSANRDIDPHPQRYK